MPKRTGEPRSTRYREWLARNAQALPEARLRAAIRHHRRLASDPIRLEAYEAELHARDLPPEPNR